MRPQITRGSRVFACALTGDPPIDGPSPDAALVLITPALARGSLRLIEQWPVLHACEPAVKDVHVAALDDHLDLIHHDYFAEGDPLQEAIGEAILSGAPVDVTEHLPALHRLQRTRSDEPASYETDWGSMRFTATVGGARCQTARFPIDMLTAVLAEHGEEFASRPPTLRAILQDTTGADGDALSLLLGTSPMALPPGGFRLRAPLPPPPADQLPLCVDHAGPAPPTLQVTFTRAGLQLARVVGGKAGQPTSLTWAALADLCG